MADLRYELDLLKAMNQKMGNKLRMYEMIIDSCPSAYICCGFERNDIHIFGPWKDYFDFDLRNIRDLTKILERVEETYTAELMEVLTPERTGVTSLSCETLLADGETWYSFNTQASYSEDGRIQGKVIRIDNITERKSQEKELSYMTHYDWMTGLYNRNYFVELLTELIAKAQETNEILSVLMIDIDDFKKINDGLGIVVGDELIKAFGNFLNSAFSDDNTLVCHMNNDVYCMAILAPYGNRTVDNIYKLIKRRCRDGFTVFDNKDVNFTVSAGVAEYPETAQYPLDLINCAEIVMFKGKTNGKNNVQYFDTPILNEFMNSITIENKLKNAIKDQAFTMYYQPLYDAADPEKLRGCEALIRWIEEDGSIISPGIFIPVAEKNGTIVKLGQWVVDETIRQYSEWSKKYSLDFVLSINISALQYRKDDFVDDILRAVRKYSVDPTRIELEITESVLVDDIKMVSDKLETLRNHGIRISLDDFGTGYSSLSYLKRFPIDTLKIDKSFVETVLKDAPTKIIVESIINMAKLLGFELVAEGVELEEQYEYLRKAGCNIIQGFLFGRPMSAEQFTDLLEEQSKK